MKFSPRGSVTFHSSCRLQATAFASRAATILALGITFGGSLMTAAGAQTAAPVPAKVTLRFKAEVGQTARLQHVAVINISANGQSMKVNISEIDKLKYIAADAATGDVTLESRTESNKVTLGDGSAPPGQESKDDVETIVTSSKDVIVSYKTTGADDDADGENTRIGQATTVVFPDGPVTVGDKWSYDYKADAKLKTRVAYADFEIVGAVKVAGVTAFKIKMAYKETGASPMAGTGTHVIEIASGDEISSDSSLTGMNVGGQTATATVHAQRLEGGPLASSKNGA